MRPLLLLLLTAAALAATLLPADARIQQAFVCWESDNEFPVDCDDTDD